ncbi:single-stranded DNA-binding protein [Actinomadura hibisca]|uniref:single-stranded DNA-binding protein n=1 Tax=Actinomadura hibisca TaxID=68565 RepID=UPI000833E22E|nr:single-stranded DNA-binding protein [Actinomadura hibisca]
MLHTDFMTEVIGHIDRDIRKLELRDGIGASFTVKTNRDYVDEYGIPHSKNMWIPCVTFDTAWADYILSTFHKGSFVQVICREVSVNAPRQAKNGKYYNSFDFVIDEIFNARELNQEAIDESAEVLAGVTAS